MLGEARVVRAIFSLVTTRQPSVRRKANAFEDALRGSFQPPLVMPIPDEVDPEMPRLVFTSLHGFSQLVVSQLSLTFSATFSEDWQSDQERVRTYLADRTDAVFTLLPLLDDAQLKYCGFVLTGRLEADASDSAILALMLRRYAIPAVTEHLHSLEVKTTEVVEGQYFRNLHVRNFRFMRRAEEQQEISPLPDGAATSRGIEVVCDCNDRYAFNEQVGYTPPREARSQVIDLAFAGLNDTLAMLREL